jgi:hypothetical protein
MHRTTDFMVPRRQCAVSIRWPSLFRPIGRRIVSIAALNHRQPPVRLRARCASNELGRSLRAAPRSANMPVGLQLVRRMPTGSSLTYLVYGVARRNDPAISIDLREEIEEVLPNPGPIAVSPTKDALEVCISVTDIEPLRRDTFESYVYEHILWHAVTACCDIEGESIRFELQSLEFSDVANGR